jgi:hypothetical protein
MDPDLGSRDAKASSAAQGASVEAQLGDQVMLAEYSALRSEVDRRVNLQWNVVALQVTSAGVIASLAISRAADIALLWSFHCCPTCSASVTFSMLLH